MFRVRTKVLRFLQESNNRYGKLAKECELGLFDFEVHVKVFCGADGCNLKGRLSLRKHVQFLKSLVSL